MKPESDLLNELTAENKYQPIDDKSSEIQKKSVCKTNTTEQPSAEKNAASQPAPTKLFFTTQSHINTA